MSVYKRTVRGKRTRNYSIDYVDEHGRRRTVSSGTSDKRLAQQIKRRLVDRARAVREGLVDLSQERFREEADKPLASHVDDYIASCKGRGQAAHGLNQKERHLHWFLRVMPGATLTTIRPDDFDMRLSALTEEGKSARTVNLKLEAARAFLNWAVKAGRLASNPLRLVEHRNEKLDRRRVRRVLTTDETRRLIAVAREQAESLPAARLRPLWYLFPLLAGLRRGDMERMTWGSLDLGAATPSLEVRGGKARRRVDRLPLHARLVSELEAVRPRHALPSARVFPKPVSNATRRLDFQRAGIPLETDEGHADLHALRHTYGTRLADRGVSPVKLKQLMRHESIDLTLRYYVHLEVDALDDSIGLLPDVEEEGGSSRASSA